MDSLSIPATKYTPEIHCDPGLRRVSVRGYSYPENAAACFAPLLAWVADSLAADPGGGVELDLELIYFNSSSSKVLLDLFDLLDAAAAAGRPVRVTWHYQEQNESARECGQELAVGLRHLELRLVGRPG